MEDKYKYTEMLEALLLEDERSHVENCVYMGPIEPDRSELVIINYKGGARAVINVTANSLGAIMKEVAREVYGGGAHGRTFYGFPGGEEAHDGR